MNCAYCQTNGSKKRFFPSIVVLNRVKKAWPNKAKTFHSFVRAWVRACNVFFPLAKSQFPYEISEWVCEKKRANCFICKGQQQQIHTHLGTKKKGAKRTKKVTTRIEKKKQGVINRRRPNLESLCSRSLNSSVCVHTRIHASTTVRVCLVCLHVCICIHECMCLYRCRCRLQRPLKLQIQYYYRYCDFFSRRGLAGDKKINEENM